MDIVVINSGSSSLKMSYFSGTTDTLDKEPAWQDEQDIDWDGESAEAIEKKMADAIEKMLKSDPAKMHIRSKDEAFTVGHRIVHGGPNYSKSIVVDEKVFQDLEKLNDFAPLHNPINLRALKLAQKLMPKATHVAAFDTAFHSTISPEVAIYPGPYSWYQDWQIKRYGFHGLSHKYCANFAKKHFEKRYKANEAGTKIAISCHLGGGCSLAALKNGTSLDTTMGFTPLEGLMMRSRSGSVDPGLLIYLLKTKKYTVEELDDVLNRKSGVKGIFEKSGDMRELEKAMSAGDSRAKLAFDMFVNSVVASIGALATKHGGLDALIFTGGIGAHSAAVRSAVCKRLAILGVKLDEKRNADTSLDALEPNCANEGSLGIFHFIAREDYQIALDCAEIR